MQPPGRAENLADLHRIVIVTINLAHQKSLVIGIGNSTNGAGEFLNCRLVQLRCIMQLTEKGLLILGQRGQLEIRVCRIIAKRRCIAIDRMHGIQPEAINPAIKPETGDLHQCRAHSRVGMIQVGLAGQEVMQIILLPS